MENAGDINSLLLDKTGTMTLGNRQAVEFLTITGVTVDELAVRRLERCAEWRVSPQPVGWGFACYRGVRTNSLLVLHDFFMTFLGLLQLKCCKLDSHGRSSYYLVLHNGARLDSCALREDPVSQPV